MKTLSESLFDRDLVKRKLTFGDLFEFDYNTPFKTKPVIDAFFVDSMRDELKTKGRQPFDVIVDGLKKLILETPIVKTDEYWLHREITKHIKKYLVSPGDDDYIVSICLGKNNHWDYRSDNRNVDLLNSNVFDKIGINIQGKVGLFFRRK